MTVRWRRAAFDLIAGMDLSRLVTRRLTLEELRDALPAMGEHLQPGIAIVSERRSLDTLRPWQ